MDIIDTVNYLENNSSCFDTLIHQNIIFTFITSLCLYILSYPLYPNSVIKKKMYSYLMDLPLFFPNKKISYFIECYIETNPITPVLDSKKTLMNWCYIFCKKLMEYSLQELFNKKENTTYSIENLNYYDFWNNILIHYYNEKSSTIIEDNSKQIFNMNIPNICKTKTKTNQNHSSKNRITEYIETMKSYIVNIVFEKKYKNQFAILFLMTFFSIILYVMYIQYKNEN